VHKHTSFDCHHLSSENVQWILGELVKICRAFPGLILIPGTILGRLPKAKSELLSGLASHKKRLESKLASKFWEGKEKGMCEQAKKTIEEGATHMGVNMAPIFFHDGATQTKLFSYKNADVSECWDDKTVHYSPIKPAAAEVDGLSLGIEICQDHTFGILKSFGIPPVDLQVILSAHTDLFPANYDVKPEGCLVHACSVASSTVVNPQSKAIAETLRSGDVSGKIEMVNLLI
jgi:hypothetical protein